jgi:hypothetical protein
LIADRFDDTYGLVARHERIRRDERSGELLVVGSAQAARFNPQQTIVGADGGQREVDGGEVAGRREHEGGGGARHDRSLACPESRRAPKAARPEAGAWQGGGDDRNDVDPARPPRRVNR